MHGALLVMFKQPIHDTAGVLWLEASQSLPACCSWMFMNWHLLDVAMRPVIRLKAIPSAAQDFVTAPSRPSTPDEAFKLFVSEGYR